MMRCRFSWSQYDPKQTEVYKWWDKIEIKQTPPHQSCDEKYIVWNLAEKPKWRNNRLCWLIDGALIRVCVFMLCWSTYTLYKICSSVGGWIRLNLLNDSKSQNWWRGLHSHDTIWQLDVMKKNQNKKYILTGSFWECIGTHGSRDARVCLCMTQFILVRVEWAQNTLWSTRQEYKRQVRISLQYFGP